MRKKSEIKKNIILIKEKEKEYTQILLTSKRNLFLILNSL